MKVADFDLIIAESRHPDALHQSALYMALIRGNLDIADLILNSIILRLEDMRFGSQCVNLHYVDIILRAMQLSLFAPKLDKSVALVKVALSVTAGGYHALTKESMQDIRWSMQGYRKALVKEVGAEAVILNLLQQLIRFSSTLFLLQLSLLVLNLTGETVHTYTSPKTVLFFRYRTRYLLAYFPSLHKCRRHLLVKSFQKDTPHQCFPPGAIHLCCCLNCPLYHHSKKQTTSTDQCEFLNQCILHTAQQLPAIDGCPPFFFHWYDMPEALIEKDNTVYLHGLGKDSFMKFENTDNTDKQFEHIHAKLAEQKVIRVVFNKTDDWVEHEISCVEFHEEVIVLDCFPF